MSVENSQALVNRAVIRAEIINYIDTYQMLLTSTMKDRIKEQLLSLLKERK